VRAREIVAGEPGRPLLSAPGRYPLLMGERDALAHAFRERADNNPFPYSQRDHPLLCRRGGLSVSRPGTR